MWPFAVETEFDFELSPNFKRYQVHLGTVNEVDSRRQMAPGHKNVAGRLNIELSFFERANQAGNRLSLNNSRVQRIDIFSVEVASGSERRSRVAALVSWKSDFIQSIYFSK